MAANSNSSTAYRIPVAPAYKELFSHFYYAHNPTKQSEIHMLLPSFQQLLVFIFGKGVLIRQSSGEQIPLKHCALLGPVKKALCYTLLPSTQMLVISFMPGSFYRFFGSLQTATNQPIDLVAHGLEDCFTGLHHSLRQLPSPEQKIMAILKFSDPYLSAKPPILNLIDKALPAAISPIKHIAATSAQSPRNIQRQHKKVLGYSAKEILRYERFLKAIQMLEATVQKRVKEDWFQIIDGCGYYDQSQLIHDFQHFLSLSPRAYLQLQKSICNPF